MKKYKTEKYSETRITEVEAVRETASSVWVMEDAWRIKGPAHMEDNT